MSKKSFSNSKAPLFSSGLKPLADHQYYQLPIKFPGDDISSIIQSQIDLDLQIIKLCRKQIAACPSGHMSAYIQPDQKCSYYYRDDVPGSSQKYLSRKDFPLHRTLAQKRYAQRMLASAEEDLALLSKFQERFIPDYPKTVLEKLKAPYRELVVPLLMNDAQYAKEWRSESFTPLSDIIGISESFETRRGEKVRSKSELIIANALYEMDIPYKYECPLHLETTIYPDFTVLNKKTRQVFYWEHFGMMDDPDYVSKTLQKFDLYSSRGILPGKDLLFSYESESAPLKTQQVYMLIQHFLV